MTPFTISWPAVSTTYFGSNLSITNGVSLVLPGCNPVLYAGTGLAGSPTAYAQMPTGNVRTVSLTSTSDLSGINFTITGRAYGQIVTEVLAGPNNNTVYFSNNYYVLNSIVPNATSANVVSVGIGQSGEVLFTQTDIWNKACAYTIAYTNVTGTVSLKPQYTVDNYFKIVNGQMVFSTPTRFNFPVANENIIVSPAGTPVPTTVTSSFSSISIPMSMLGTNVATGTTGSFDQIIIQQGGRP